MSVENKTESKESKMRINELEQTLALTKKLHHVDQVMLRDTLNAKLRYEQIILAVIEQEDKKTSLSAKVPVR